MTPLSPDEERALAQAGFVADPARLGRWLDAGGDGHSLPASVALRMARGAPSTPNGRAPAAATAEALIEPTEQETDSMNEAYRLPPTAQAPGRLVSYEEFLRRKSQHGAPAGFAPLWLPSSLFDFQASMVDWSLRQGRAALLEDCGLGKSLQELVWGENVVRHTNGRVLLLTPLAVGAQMLQEAEKFGVEARRSLRGELHPGITIANYERLHLFNPSDFAGVICDEGSILKSFDGTTRRAVTEFLRAVRYRLIGTANAAPNDNVELGTCSEALGHLGYMDMLTRFFRNEHGTAQGRGNFAAGGHGVTWRFKGHAEQPFWRWVASWARALRRPSDLGFDDRDFALPPLIEREHLVGAPPRRAGELFADEEAVAVGLAEERAERKRTLRERCERAASLVAHTGQPAVAWCNLNPEGDLLEQLIPGAVQVSGRDGDEAKEEKFAAFAAGEIRVLVIKPVIGAWGLNWQHCAHAVVFPTHSYEQHYQLVRRSWRFGQKREVVVDVVAGAGERGVLANLRRKGAQADRMFAALVAHMRDGVAAARDVYGVRRVEVPSWL